MSDEVLRLVDFIQDNAVLDDKGLLKDPIAVMSGCVNLYYAVLKEREG